MFGNALGGLGHLLFLRWRYGLRSSGEKPKYGEDV